MTDISYSPWPAPGRSISFTLSRGVWVRCEPFYGDYVPADVTWGPKVQRGWFPFLTINTRWFHLYLGWKPITLADPKFYWRTLVPHANDELFVQLSSRWGWGEIQ